jgi:shikimate 5-dehydrogenase
MAASACDDPVGLLRDTVGAAGAVYDVRYGAVTRELRDAALRRGLLYAEGTSLLLAQGILSLAAFRGAPLPPEAIAAMRRELVAP